jgi:hypothetical protein
MRHAGERLAWRRSDATWLIGCACGCSRPWLGGFRRGITGPKSGSFPSSPRGSWRSSSTTGSSYVKRPVQPYQRVSAAPPLICQETLEDLVREAPSKQSESLGLAAPCGHTSLDVRLTGTIATPLGNRDSMQSRVDLAVAAAVESVPSVVAGVLPWTGGRVVPRGRPSRSRQQVPTFRNRG